MAHVLMSNLFSAGGEKHMLFSLKEALHTMEFKIPWLKPQLHSGMV